MGNKCYSFLPSTELSHHPPTCNLWKYLRVWLYSAFLGIRKARFKVGRFSKKYVNFYMPPYLRQSGRRNGYQQLKLPAWVTYVPCHAHCPCCHIEVKVGELFLSKWLKTVCVAGILMVTIRYICELLKLPTFFWWKQQQSQLTEAQKANVSFHCFTCVTKSFRRRLFRMLFDPLFSRCLFKILRIPIGYWTVCGFKNTMAQCMGRVVALHFLSL